MGANDNSNPLTLGRFWQPVVLEGHFCNSFGSAYIDMEIDYQGIDPLEINACIFSYIYRDTLLESGITGQEQ